MENKTSSRTSLAAKATLWYAICSIAQKCVGLIVIPIYTRMMVENEYGVYVVFQSWTEIAAILITLNLGSYVFNNGMMKYKDDRDGFTSSMLGLTGVIGLLWMVAFLLASDFWAQLLGMAAPYVFLLVLRCIVTPCYSYWSARLRYEFRYKPVVALTLCLSIATPAISIPVIYFANDKVTAALVCQVAIMSIVYLVPLCSIVKKSRKFFCVEYWKFALRFNLPLIPHLLSTVALQQCDRIMIAQICGSFYAAIYSVAYSAGLAMSFIHSAIVQSLTPWMYQTMQAEKYDDIQSVGIILVCIVGIASLLLALLAPEIMAIFAPASYQAGIYAIPPVAASLIMMTVFNLFVTVEYYYEETIAVMLASLVAGIANVVLNALLLPYFGFVVAGYTTLACYFLLAIGHYFLMRRSLRLHNQTTRIFEPKTFFPVVILFAGGIVLVSLLYPFSSFRYAILSACCCIAFIVVISKRALLKERISQFVRK